METAMVGFGVKGQGDSVMRFITGIPAVLWMAYKVG